MSAVSGAGVYPNNLKIWFLASLASSLFDAQKRGHIYLRILTPFLCIKNQGANAPKTPNFQVVWVYR